MLTKPSLDCSGLRIQPPDPFQEQGDEWTSTPNRPRPHYPLSLSCTSLSPLIGFTYNSPQKPGSILPPFSNKGADLVFPFLTSSCFILRSCFATPPNISIFWGLCSWCPSTPAPSPSTARTLYPSFKPVLPSSSTSRSPLPPFSLSHSLRPEIDFPRAVGSETREQPPFQDNPADANPPSGVSPQLDVPNESRLIAQATPPTKRQKHLATLASIETTSFLDTRSI